MILNLLYRMFKEVLFIFLKIYDMVTKTDRNMQTFAVTQNVYVCFIQPQQENP